MVLEQIYYVGELVGVMALIASLIYVGRQVKQSNSAMRNSASTEFSNGLNALTIAMVLNRGFAEIWTKGANEFDSLDEVDKRRLVLFEYVGMTTWRRSFELHQQGLLSEEVWREQLRGIETLSQRQSVQIAWEEFRSAFDPAFREMLQKSLK
jgi:hypothetical protein